jgi:hypothetical protein
MTTCASQFSLWLICTNTRCSEKAAMEDYIYRGHGFLFIYSADHRKSLELAKENYRRVIKIKRHERDNAMNPIPGMLVAVRVEEEDRAMWMEVPWEGENVQCARTV